MRLLVHDYGAYAFTNQLAAELARRGHSVDYASCRTVTGTPVGVDASASGFANFRSHEITQKATLQKDALLSRLRWERAYGRRLSHLIKEISPNLVLCANTPIDALAPAYKASRKCNARFYIWLQDLIGEAASSILNQKLGLIGSVIGSVYRHREWALLRKADRIVAISDDFGAYLQRAGIESSKWSVIENWAPFDEITPYPRDNQWSKDLGLDRRFVYMYSGTLGWKHNPNMLISLARSLKHQAAPAVVVVNSEGRAADWLRKAVAQEGLQEYLLVNGFVPIRQLSQALSSSDVLVALLEADAGKYSVPSKILTYLCMGRPILAAIPKDNGAASTIRKAAAGIVCEPGVEAEFVSAALTLLSDTDTRMRMSVSAREYAATEFAIKDIADNFEREFSA